MCAQAQNEPFGFLRDLQPALLSNELSRESSKVAAVVLAHFDRVLSAQVLADFPPQFQREVVREMRSARNTPPAILEEIASSLRERLSAANSPAQTDAADPAQGSKINYGGPEVAAAILRFASPETRKLIQESDPTLWSNLQTRMYIFDDFLHTPHRSLQLIFQEVEVKTMALALKAVVPSLKKRIYANISPRRTALVEEELGRLERLNMSDIEAAQQDIINRALELQRGGQVILDEREAI
ncbi:MAG: FliG C-terminal domain-containing protein [Planctomycetota bacterium]